MYSYEQRITAVKLYIKLGKRQSEARRILGYPKSKKLIRRWYLKYIEDGDLNKDYERPSHFTNEQKETALMHYFSNGQCAARTMKALGYPCRAVLNRWIDACDREALNRQHGKHFKPSQLNEEEKKQAVIDFCLRDTSADSISKDVGVSRQLLYKWKAQYLSNNYSAPMKKQNVKEINNETGQLKDELSQLKHQMHELQLEHDILKKANELLKKDHGISHQLLTNREKTILIDALVPRYKLTELLKCVDIPKSSYFYHKTRLRLPDKYAPVKELIRDIFNKNWQCYGYRRIQAALRALGIFIAEKVIRRLMREDSLIPFSSRRKRNYSSYYDEISPAVDNINQRDFRASKPNRKWLTDITEFHITAGKVYLSPIIDCFDGLVVSWSIGTRPTAELANLMLDQAIKVLKTNEYPIIHSDRGGHYRWPGWIKRMNEAKLTRSMSRKGCSSDNAACEAFFGKLKTEFFYPRDWSNKSIEQLIEEINCYINWYNQKRIKISLDSKSPIEYRASLGYAA